MEFVTTSFGTPADQASAVALQPDGKILLAGSSDGGGTSLDFAMARYTSAGALDTTFGGGDGMVTTPIGPDSNTARAMALQLDGKILLAGNCRTGNFYDIAMARYTSVGALDATFGDGDGIVVTSIGTNDSAESIALQRDGKILLGGYGCVADDYDFALLRFTAAGTPDLTFGGGDGRVTTPIGSPADDRGAAVAIQPDGRILLGGHTSYSSVEFAAVRYTSQGTLDTSFGGDGSSPPESVHARMLMPSRFSQTARSSWPVRAWSETRTTFA
jgi:uncharacterized delta-60 repeat protein